MIGMFHLIKTMFWILVLILALSFFGISLQAIVTSPAAQANFAYVYHLGVQGWEWVVAATQAFL